MFEIFIIFTFLWKQVKLEGKIELAVISNAISSNGTKTSTFFLLKKLRVDTIYAPLKGHNWMHFAHRLEGTVTLNSNYAIF